ncbi:MAG: restriction endonuclease [Acidobacteriia bacterium]|nr:restriction endonuclease [Terriglobia bacterium]
MLPESHIVTPQDSPTPEENSVASSELVEYQQLFVAVQIGPDTEEPVMIPVDDLAIMDTPEGKEQVFDAAWRFYQHGQYVREATNPAFIAALAEDFEKQLPLPEMLARLSVARIGEHYLKRFESEAPEHGERLVDSHAKHLRFEGRDTDSPTIVFDPPDGWEDTAIERFRTFTNRLFSTGSKGITTWVGFTNWLWLNQLTRALDGLEERLGEDALERLSDQEFETQLAEAFEYSNAAHQVTQLVTSYLDLLADLLLECAIEATPDLWMLEVLLGLRDQAPENVPRPSGRIIPVDFSALLPAIAARPEDLYQLPPRRFEQLIAHIFERFGYNVELTPETNDGGFDMVASKREEIDVRVLVECKRYTPPNKVGRPIVQQLLGVLNDRQQHATKAVLATTSTFTPPAKQLLASNHWRLEGRDRDAILTWIASLGIPSKKQTLGKEGFLFTPPTD